MGFGQGAECRLCMEEEEDNIGIVQLSCNDKNELLGTQVPRHLSQKVNRFPPQDHRFK